MFNDKYARSQRDNLNQSYIENLINPLYNLVINNNSDTYDIDAIADITDKILSRYILLEDNIKIICSKDLVNRHLVLFTKILTICNIETTGYLFEMNIPQIIIGVYKNKNNIPKIPYILGVKIPKIEDIVPDSSGYVDEFLRSFIIMYNEYFYSEEVELENFKIPLYLAHNVDYINRKIYDRIMDWFHRYLKGRNRILNATDMYLIELMNDFISETIFKSYDINWTKVYCTFNDDVGTELMPYYFEASLDCFWVLDQLLRTVLDTLYDEISVLIQNFYYNPLLIRLIIGTKIRMFTTYARKVGKYYYESII